MSADRFTTSEFADPSPSDDHPSSAADDAAKESPVGTRVRQWPVIVGGAVAIGAIVWLLASPQRSDVRAVQDGRRFSPAERRHAEEALRSAGIESFRADDNRLHVPAKARIAADQALARNDAEPGSHAHRWQAAGSLLDHFATPRQQELADSAARAAQVARLLEQQPGVSAAEIVWDEEPRTARRRPPRVRATVFLTPEPGFAIGPDTVHAVRMAVAGSRAHLDPADVVVMDLLSRVTYEAPQDPESFARQARQAELIGVYRTRIESSLAGLPGTQVAVRVNDADPYPSDRSGRQPDSLPPALPLVRQSGPNLRLAVPPKLAVPTGAAQADPLHNPPTGADPAVHLDVTVDVPSDALVAQQNPHAGLPETQAGRDLNSGAVLARAQSDLRQRIAAAVARALPSRASVNLTVRFDPPVSSLVTARSPQGGATTFWRIFPAANALDLPPLSVIVMSLAVLTAVSLAARRYVRRRGQRAPKSPPLTRSTGPAGAIPELRRPETAAAARQPFDVPDAFLPGIAVDFWAPIVAREPAPVIAGLLRVLAPDEVARLIEQLSPAQQRDVLVLTASASLTGGDLDDLRERIRAHAQAAPRPPRRPIKQIRQSRVSPDGAAAVAPELSLPSHFEALLDVDDACLRQLVERIPAETWAAALTASPPKLLRRLTKVSGGSDWLRRTRQSRPLRLREIESAQRLILDECRALPPLPGIASEI